MAVNPHDLLDDSFPHGTVDGERQGCVTRNCPAQPLQCLDVARNYRTDHGFKQLYNAGMRGEELVEAWKERAVAEPAVFVSSPEQSRLDDLEGPQARQLWVLLDANQNVVLATAQPEVAVAALAEAWRAYLDPERA